MSDPNRIPKNVAYKRSEYQLLRERAVEFINRLDKAARLRDWQIDKGNASTASLKRFSYELSRALIQFRKPHVPVDVSIHSSIVSAINNNVSTSDDEHKVESITSRQKSTDKPDAPA